MIIVRCRICYLCQVIPWPFPQKGCSHLAPREGTAPVEEVKLP